MKEAEKTTYSFQYVSNSIYDLYEPWDPNFPDDYETGYESGQVGTYSGSIFIPDGEEAFVVNNDRLTNPWVDWERAFYVLGNGTDPVAHDLFEFTWSGGTALLYRLSFSDYQTYDDGSDLTYRDEAWIMLGGDPLPPLSWYTDDLSSHTTPFDTFIAGGQLNPVGPDFADGATVYLTDYPGVTVNPEDFVDGTTGDDVFHLGDGNDRVDTAWGSPGRDLFDGGDGIDEIFYYADIDDPARDGVVLDLRDPDRNDGAALGDTVLNFEPRPARGARR